MTFYCTVLSRQCDGPHRLAVSVITHCTHQGTRLSIAAVFESGVNLKKQVQPLFSINFNTYRA